MAMNELSVSPESEMGAINTESVNAHKKHIQLDVERLRDHFNDPSDEGLTGRDLWWHQQTVQNDLTTAESQLDVLNKHKETDNRSGISESLDHAKQDLQKIELWLAKYSRHYSFEDHANGLKPTEKQRQTRSNELKQRKLIGIIKGLEAIKESN